MLILQVLFNARQVKDLIKQFNFSVFCLSFSVICLSFLPTDICHSHSNSTPEFYENQSQVLPSRRVSRKMVRRNTTVLKLTGGRTLRLKKVHLFWLCPNMECFEWFFDLLSEIETKKNGKLIETHIYLTRGWKRGNTASVQIFFAVHICCTFDSASLSICLLFFFFWCLFVLFVFADVFFVVFVF